MNLLITTLGTSWQIIPELIGITNPENYDFFCSSKEVDDFRKANSIKSIDECWVITTEGQNDLDKLSAWAQKWNVQIKVFICKGVNSFASSDEILKMRSLIYRVVLNGKEKSAVTYFSLSGGRKTMSADMQEAGNLFGSDSMLHVVDKKGLPENMKSDNLLSVPNTLYAESFIPLLVNAKNDASLVVAGDKERIKASDYPLLFTNDLSKNCQIILYDEDGLLEKEIQNRKKRSSQLYANFYGMINNSENGRRDLFRKLYFLHPDILRNLQNYKIGKNKSKDEKLLKSFPKTDLHSHLGGVLTASEIIQVAKTETAFIAETPNEKDFKAFINKILSFNSVETFDKEIFGNFLDSKKYFRIGIDAYQRLGDFQGSKLLQTKNTVSKAVSLYAAKLIAENVRYVEIRCSPYKYTKLGLSTNDVVNCIMDSLDSFSEKLEYRLICIIGRESGIEQINDSVNKITELMKTNERFKNKLVGIDLAGNEGKTNPAKLRESFMPFLENCIRITIHAGETESVENIWEAVYHLSADRIGHGLKLLDKPELMQRFIDKNIGIEMCPSSNNQIVGFSDGSLTYPLQKYLNEGLKVTLNTDNCGISRTSVTDEFIKAASLCPDLSLWDCIVLIRNSLSVAFCDTKTKMRLMHQAEDEILSILNSTEFF